MTLNEHHRQRANELYIQLSGQIRDSELSLMKDYLYETIPPSELESCDKFSDICRCLTRKGKINPLDHSYILQLLTKAGREDLRTRVEQFHKEHNESSELSIPLTCLYNEEKTLPIEERLDEFLNVLERFLAEGPDTIPQQLFYTNVAAGIARPEQDHLRKDCSVSVPKGAVSEKKIIYCHYVEGLSPCLLASGENLVCYSIPILLGPPGERFNPEHKVVLDIACNAIAPCHETKNIKLFVRHSDEPVWRDGGEHFCLIRNDGPATILLQHFSEFVIGADPSNATGLPPLRARVDTLVKCITERKRCLVICIMFDSPFTIKKAYEKIGKRGNGLSGQNIEFQPLSQCLIQARGDRWRTKDPIADVTKEEFSTLVFNPIVREVEVVLQGSHVYEHADTMCDISFTQKSKCQTFIVKEATLKLDTAKKASRSSLHAELGGIADRLNTNDERTTASEALTEVRKQQVEIQKCIELMQVTQNKQAKLIQNTFDVVSTLSQQVIGFNATSKAMDKHYYESNSVLTQGDRGRLPRNDLRRPVQSSSKPSQSNINVLQKVKINSYLMQESSTNFDLGSDERRHLGDRHDRGEYLTNLGAREDDLLAPVPKYNHDSVTPRPTRTVRGRMEGLDNSDSACNSQSRTSFSNCYGSLIEDDSIPPGPRYNHDNGSPRPPGTTGRTENLDNGDDAHIIPLHLFRGWLDADMAEAEKIVLSRTHSSPSLLTHGSTGVSDSDLETEFRMSVSADSITLLPEITSRIQELASVIGNGIWL